jgi:hypothetical protein
MAIPVTKSKKSQSFLGYLRLILFFVVISSFLGSCVPKNPNWQVSWIESSRIAYNNARGVHLAVDDDNVPHVVYVRNDLYYAYPHVEDRRWQITKLNEGIVATAKEGSIAIDVAGQPHITFESSATQARSGQLYYTYLNNSVWFTEKIPTVENSASSVMVLNREGMPVILYRPERTHSLYLIRRVEDEWQNEAILENMFTSNMAIALDLLDRPWIAWMRLAPTGSMETYVAYERDATWSYERIYESHGRVRGGIALAIDQENRPHVTFHHFGRGTLVYAFHDGVNWQIQEVDQGESVGWWPSVAIDSLGRPHISYGDFGQDRLKYAYWDGITWQIEVVDTGRIAATSLAIDNSGGIHIAYMLGSGDRVKHAYRVAPER